MYHELATLSSAKISSAVSTYHRRTLALADLQAPDQSAQHPAAQHYDDSSVISYVCQQVSMTRCDNIMDVTCLQSASKQVSKVASHARGAVMV